MSLTQVHIGSDKDFWVWSLWVRIHIFLRRFFHAFVMVAPRDAKADVYHMY